MMEQKVKQVNGNIGAHIRKIRLGKGIGQTELVGMLQLQGISMTRECLVKLERGIQHITVTQLRGIRDCLGTTYEELLDGPKE
jgi:transcriptional regulator with XRE-family HTH domain